ncbi:MAG: HAD-IA family hydrolase [Coriobacteriales bacterium]|jgi:pyrophosphatase PpaX|nr:HAD-IA family hydrolase [Coriobacteriales bacterium]
MTETAARAARAVLFDLDGTLLDTRDLILGSFKHAFAEVLGEAPPDDEMLDLVGIPLPDQMRHFSPQHADDLVAAFRKHTDEVHDRQVRSFAGVTEALTTLRAAGLRLAVVTSKRHALAWRGLKVFGLERFQEFLIGADDCPEHKPRPGALLLAAERMKLAPADCVYVGDSPYDMQAANSAQMLAVGALWGMFTEQRLIEAGAKLCAARPAELPEMLGVVS